MTVIQLKQRHANEVITMAHGSGGKAMQKLIEEIIVGILGKSTDRPLEDQAPIPLSRLGDGQLVMTTDSYVVTPLFFPGSSIGHLAVNGTVNDLAVGGATPLMLSCGLILEEGLPINTLIDVLVDMREAADKAGVYIGTGDTKVVERGSCDGLFINTAGVGCVPKGLSLEIGNIQVGDKIILSGNIGEHGVALLAARGDMSIHTEIHSDCAGLNTLTDVMLEEAPSIRVMRDVTRGGVATVLNEFAQGAEVGILVDEKTIPMREDVQGFCDVLGLDAMYLANEGKLIAVVPEADAETLIEAMRKHPLGQDACIIGEVVEEHPQTVVVQSSFGGSRVMDMLVGDQLPRIC